MKTPIFIGSGTAIVTPFRKDDVLKIDFDKMAELIELQIRGGTQAIIVNGTTGENATQPVNEHIGLIEFCISKVNGRIKVITGIGSNDTMTSLTLATHAKKFGADGVLMVTPYYNKTTQHGLVKHFTYVADRIDLPMILYNVPGRTTLSISAETYKVLSGHPNINGIKEASGDFTLVSNTLALCGDSLNLYSGNDDNTVPMMSLGAVGVISVASNIVPGVIARLCDLCLAGDFKAATELHLKYMNLFNKLFIEVNPVPVKAALNLMGMDVGIPRLPLCEMLPENLEKLKAAMRDADIKTI